MFYFLNKFFIYPTLVITLLFNVFVLSNSFLFSESATTDRDRVLEVKDSDGNFAGIIVGSMHGNFTEEELQPTKDLFIKQISSVDRIFIECEPTHWTSLNMGTARTLLELLEKTNHRSKLLSLESFSDQLYMISCWYQVGGKNYLYPTGYFPHALQFIGGYLNFVNRIIWSITNTIYFSTYGNLDEISRQEVEQVSSMRKSYLENKTSQIQANMIDYAQVLLRDRVGFEKFQAHYKKGETFLYVVGMAHLSADKGILSHFENAGYTLKAYEPDEL